MEKTDEAYLKELLPLLRKEMPFKWRVQSFSKFKPEATCVAYIDARDVMQRLDEHCIWQREHREIKGHVYAGIGVHLPSEQILWRWDCGVESNVDAEKGESSDSFKRAAVNFGIGRFLYDLEIKRLPANEKKVDKPPRNYPYVVDNKNKRVWDLTKHINGDYKPLDKKSEQVTVETLITFIYSCKTVTELNKYYKDNKELIESFFEKEKVEVMAAFKSHKKELEDK